MSALGATVVEGQKEHTLRLVRHVRRFFAKEAPAEIWALFRPRMDNLHSSQAMEVCRLLSLFCLSEGFVVQIITHYAGMHTDFEQLSCAARH